MEGCYLLFIIKKEKVVEIKRIKEFVENKGNCRLCENRMRRIDFIFI
jgi:hypothetical protein